jgi:predicted hydrolase (HD superfamily)
MQRAIAIEMLEEYVAAPHILIHAFAVEAVMKALANHFDPDHAELWGLAGLLHDLDEDLVDWRSDMSLHGPKTVELLKARQFGNDELYGAILAHNPENGSVIQSPIERALYAADPMTGFINAIALVYPDKKLSSVKLKSITKRMKETRFAAGANREAMKSIESLGMPFEAFAELSLKAMTEISDVLGL